MPVTTSYPGVYVQEVPSGVRSIAGVATSTGLFLGASRRGPIGEPKLCLSYTDVKRTFGEDASAGDLSRYLKLFFLNGGTQAYVMRLAHGAGNATVDLHAEDDTPVLRLTARSAGAEGENIRALVTYKTAQPEATFAIEIFRWDTSSATPTATDTEVWTNLSMDPNSPAYAVDFLTQRSRLVRAAVVAAPSAARGSSRAGRIVAYADTSAGFTGAWPGLLGALRISVGGNDYVDVDLASSPPAFSGSAANRRTQLVTHIQNAINTRIAPLQVTVTIENGLTPLPGGQRRDRLVITADTAGNDVFVRPGRTGDCTAALMLGTAQGGIEIGSYAAQRPAPTGVTLPPRVALDTFAGRQNQDVTELRLDGFDAAGAPSVHVIPIDLTAAGGAATDPVWQDNGSSAAAGHSDGLREKLGLLRDAINDHRAANSRTFFWSAELWGHRLAIRPTAGADNLVETALPTSAGMAANFGAADAFRSNVRHYTVGALGFGVGFQTNPTTAATDGDPPLASDYDAAYETVRAEVDLFNLLVLPPSRGTGAIADHNSLYANASVFCQEERAFLVMDPPAAWDSVQTAINTVAAQRVGLVSDHAAIYFPNVVVDEDGRQVVIGPSGAVAGLYARTDGTRGVWKAPAGTDASLRGVVGLAQRLGDRQSGVLNPEGINALRALPTGLVSWGTRTLDGADAMASEYKYVPIRRLALYIEESLYRGLHWAVFEPNDEGLWAQIRLNVGAFLHGLYRQGAFEGATPDLAYFVKCDAETTPASDRNLGVVNIWVGFAPLKPAEFVVLYLQQMAGQSST